MYGQYILRTANSLLMKTPCSLWLSKRDLKGETTSEIAAAQDQALQTKCHATKILQTETDTQCRLSQQSDETVEHILYACPTLAKEQCIKRHDI